MGWSGFWTGSRPYHLKGSGWRVGGMEWWLTVGGMGWWRLAGIFFSFQMAKLEMVGGRDP